MKVLNVFEQHTDRGTLYVVTQGCVNDIACYRGPAVVGVRGVADHGEKLTEAQFRRTYGCWNFEADGLHYRR